MYQHQIEIYPVGGEQQAQSHHAALVSRCAVTAMVLSLYEFRALAAEVVPTFLGAATPLVLVRHDGRSHPIADL